MSAPKMVTERAPILALGTRVRFDDVLVRKLVHEKDHGWGRGIQRWLPTRQPKERDGVLVGYRTKYDGYTRYSREDGNEFRALSHRRVALVAVTLYANPVAVDPATLREVES